jgi:cell division protease FtsH
MSDLIGPQQLGHKNGEVFLGRDLGHQPNYSDEVAARIDAEVRRLIDEAHTEALDILTENRKVLDRLAKALVEKETLDTPEVMEVLGPVTKRPSRTRPASAPARTQARRRVARSMPKPQPRPRPNPNPA